MERDEYGIREIRCSTAKQLIDELEENHERWANAVWIFRGQNSFKWRLQPSAMRSKYVADRHFEVLEAFRDEAEMFHEIREDIMRSRDIATNDDYDRWLSLVLHVLIERNVVPAFAELADQVGLAIPLNRYASVGGQHRPLAKQLLDYLLTDEDHPQFDPEDVIYALAQHHGMPTRLLDWTYRPFVAAYFAAYRDKHADPLRTRMVVWAMKRKSLEDTSLIHLSHLRSQIGFLQSQDGTFLYDTQANKKFLETGIWQPFEAELQEISGSGAVYKFTLPFSRSQDLLRRLSLKFISKPFLMPSFDNVAEEIIEERVKWSEILDA